MLADYLSIYNVRVPCVLSCRILIFAMTSMKKVSSMIIILIILYVFISGASIFELCEKLSGLSIIKFLHWLQLHL